MKRRDEVTVGILVTVAVIVLIVGALWLARGGLSSGYPLYGRFAWGQSLKQGQPALLAGVNVGYVADVELANDGFLDVEIRINKQYKIPTNSVAEVIPIGIFGDAAVAFKTPGPSSVVFQPGDTVPTAKASSGLDALTARADTISRSLGQITAAMERELVGGGGIREMRQTIATMNRLTSQMQGVVAEQNRNLTSTMAAFRSTAKGMDSAQVASTMAQFRSSAANADSLMMRLSSNSTQLQAILARVERGEGTVGKLLSDTLLYRDMRNLLASTDSLMADFKKNPRKYINLQIF